MTGNTALSVSPPVSALERFGADQTAPRRAREATERFLRDRTGAEETATALLLVSELVTNSVTASGKIATPQVSLSLRIIGDALLIRVIDFAPGIPKASKPENPQEHGYGLFLVEELSSRFGYFLMGGGRKCTYCIFPMSGDNTGGANHDR